MDTSRPEFNQKVRDVARSWVGVAFRNNGRTRSQGVDCLGLLLCVFREVGLEPPPESLTVAYRFDWFLHTVHSDMLTALRTYGREVPIPEMRVGDVPYFAPGRLYRQQTDLVTHAGIYVGGGQFVHSATGKGVMESSLSVPAWGGSIVGAVRLLVIEHLLGEDVV